jgi:predicted  nucleic acid-binding Zn-ribbon protein
MTKTMMGSLRELQKIDEEVRTLRSEIEAFDPRLAEVEEPALRLEAEFGKNRDRLDQMRTDARRLERGAEDKRARAKRLDERLNQVSNLREEAAVRTELDLIRRAIEAEEQEAMTLLEQVRRSEIALEELEEATLAARAEVEPNQEAMLAQRGALKERLSQLRARRDVLLETLGDAERRVYESFHGSGRKVVVAVLTEDGACGACYGMVPLQLQNEIRRGSGLLRCEACGVILTAEPEPEEETPASSGPGQLESEGSASEEMEPADIEAAQSESPGA